MTTHVQTLPRLDPHFIYAADAVGSLVFGIALLFTATQVTELAGWNMPSSFLRTVGLLLLPWAAFNLWIGRAPRPPRAAVIANIAGDTIWVTLSAALVAIHMTSLSAIGLAMLAGQGIAVTGVLALKLLGARNLV